MINLTPTFFLAPLIAKFVYNWNNWRWCFHATYYITMIIVCVIICFKKKPDETNLVTTITNFQKPI